MLRSIPEGTFFLCNISGNKIAGLRNFLYGLEIWELFVDSSQTVPRFQDRIKSFGDLQFYFF